MIEHDEADLDLRLISDAEFISGWQRIVGEPPAAMLDDRREMIALLVDSVGVAGWPLRPATHARPRSTGPANRRSTSG
jgi:hypothetical protein